MKGSWSEGLTLLAMTIALAVQFWSVTRPVTTKPTKPGELDELL